MIMGVSIAAYGAGHVPPDDARLLQGADVHGGRLGDRGDGGQAEHRPHVGAARARCRSRSSRSWSRRSRWPRSPASRATSPRTRSSRSPPSAAAATGSCTSAGTVAALMTAFYAFRMVFRVFGGEPNEEARELERGHLHHAEPVNPMTGEPEDTDVGYPGPEHHIAEREPPMRGRRWRSSRSSSVFAGVAPDPGRHARGRELPRPHLRGLALRRHRRVRRASRRWRWSSARLCVARRHRARLAALRARSPARRCGSRERFRGLHDFLAHKWYFDELYDRAIVRPDAARSARGRRACSSAS